MFSCKKEEETSVRGHAYDNSALANAPSVHVKLIERFNDHTIYIAGVSSNNYKYTVLKEGDTDANGYFDLGTFSARKDKKYDYYINKDVYGLTKGEDNDITIQIYDGITYLYTYFLPPPPYNVGDSLTVTYTHSVYTNHKFKIKDIGYSSQNYYEIISGKYYINIDKYKSGIYSNLKDTVFYPNKTTNSYNVNW